MITFISDRPCQICGNVIKAGDFAKQFSEGYISKSAHLFCYNKFKVGWHKQEIERLDSEVKRLNREINDYRKKTGKMWFKK